MKINILGTKYVVRKKKYSKDPLFEKRTIDGYCDDILKEIVYCDMSTYKGFENEPPEYCEKCESATLRHEIIHAFLSESGLCESSNQSSGAWAKNEEMVDWIALQSPKLLKAFRKVGCL